MCFQEDPRVRHGAGCRGTASEIRNNRCHGVPCFHRTHQHGVLHGCTAGPRAKAMRRQSGMAPGRAAPPSGICPVGKSTGTPCLRGWAAPQPGPAHTSGRADARGHVASLVDTGGHAPGRATGWKAGGAAAPTPSGGLRSAAGWPRRRLYTLPHGVAMPSPWEGPHRRHRAPRPREASHQSRMGRGGVVGRRWSGGTGQRPLSPGSSATRGQPPVEEGAGRGRDAYSTGWRRRRRREVGARMPLVRGVGPLIWRRSGCCSLAVREKMRFK